MKIEPLHSNVVVKPLNEKEETSSGIVLPESADRDKPMQGEVVAVGPGKKLESGERSSMDVKEGDTVLFTKYAPDEFELDGEEYLVLDEEKIIAILRN